MPFYKISFSAISPDQQEILIARLSEIGYSGFEQFDDELFAYVEEKDFAAEPLDESVATFNTNYTKEKVPDQNWNNAWESNFPPVTVDNIAGIRADFHAPISDVKHEIIITPKMSFGTGHHATTFLMIQCMDEILFKDKKVLDFGTGTGILAILAEKMGAASVTAIDYDEWSIENAAENIRENRCEKIRLEKQDSAKGNESYGIILANINRNVIIDNLFLLRNQLEEGGEMLLSGLLVEDEDLVKKKALETGLSFVKKQELNRWILLRFSYFCAHLG